MESYSPRPAREIIVFDTSSFIDLGDVGLLEAVLTLPRRRFLTTAEVDLEIRKEPYRGRLISATSAHLAAVIALEEHDEFNVKEEIARRLDQAESACIAMAVKRGWKLLCEERNRKFESEVRKRLTADRILRIDVLIAAVVREGVMGLSAVEKAIRSAAASHHLHGAPELGAHALRVLDRAAALFRNGVEGELCA